MARPMRCRTRNLNLCPLVQHKPPTPRPGCHRTPTSRKPTCNNANERGLNAPTRDPGLGRPIKRLHHAGTAPVAGRCTLYGELHPIRTGAMPTDRVQCPRIGCNAHGSGVPRSQTRMTAEPGIPQRERKRPQRPYMKPGTWQACDSPRCTSLRDSKSAATCSISLTLVEYACSNRIDRTKEFSCPA